MTASTAVHAVERSFRVNLTNGDTRVITADYYTEKDGWVFFVNGQPGGDAVTLVDGIAKRRIVSIETGAGSDE